MKIDPWGKITWTPTATQVSSDPYTVEVKVTYGDVRGELKGTFSLKVKLITAPVLTLTAPKIVPASTTNVDFKIQAKDDDGIKKVSLDAVEFIQPNGTRMVFDDKPGTNGINKNNLYQKPYSPSTKNTTLVSTPFSLANPVFSGLTLQGGILKLRATATDTSDCIGHFKKSATQHRK